MKSNIVSSSFSTPEINISTIDFQTYLSSLVGDVLVASLIFFGFVLCIYLLYLTVHYFIIFLKPLTDSKFDKQNLNQELPVENVVI